MKRNVVVFAASVSLATAGLVGAGTAPASAAGLDCTGYEMELHGTLTQGQSRVEPNGTYYWFFNPGTQHICLDGPDGTDFNLELQQFAPDPTTGWYDWQPRASANSVGDDTLDYASAPGTFSVIVTASQGSGPYTLGITRP